jgi:hypothetical protein
MMANIYGVDINAASVEIAQLALWLHTARGNQTLSSLDHNIREGNSLIGPDFYKGQIDMQFYDENQRERVNAFDWQSAFPEVFERGGFDAVVSNPPYVKLQNFKTVHTDMANFLREGRPGVVPRPYVSTQTGNFDIYLPFIERGISLLNEKGRLGYIAPSLWIGNEYGDGLRKLIASGYNLDRWIDFKSYQVFEEATTYTALQFYTNSPNQAIRVAEAPTGDIPVDPWPDAKCALAYGKQVFGDRWLLLTGEERELIDRLYKRCKRLDDPAYTKHIFQGLITSADYIYHLKHLGPGRYWCAPKKESQHKPYEVQIEDALMKPLVSGAEAKRYITPDPNTYILFPYIIGKNNVTLINAATIASQYPKAWKHLTDWEDELRTREVKTDTDGKITEAPFDDDQWYRFGRNQNLDKQEIVKLIVAQTVSEMRVCLDDSATMYLNNVRVNGIVCSDTEDPWFLLGVLNSSLIDFVFRRITKVKDGGFFEANRQFIAPLPIPPTSASDKKAIIDGARALQAAYTQRRDTLASIARRLSAMRRRNRADNWLFPGLKTRDHFEAEAPINLLDDERKREWVDQKYEDQLAGCYSALSARIRTDASLDASFKDGELSFTIDGIPVIDKIFLSPAEGEFILAQWKVLASTFNITEKTEGKKLTNALRKLALPENPAAIQHR